MVDEAAHLRVPHIYSGHHLSSTRRAKRGMTAMLHGIGGEAEEADIRAPRSNSSGAGTSLRLLSNFTDLACDFPLSGVAHQFRHDRGEYDR